MTTHTITLARHTAQVVGLMGVLVLGTWDSYGTEQLLLRHGPADQSAPDAFIGRTNPALTEQGREIAKAAGRRLSHLQIGGVYTSPLIRCVQTGRLLGRENLPVETVEGLAERDFGAWEGRSRA